MNEIHQLILFFVFISSFIFLWGKILWYFSENSKPLNKLVLYLMSYLRYSRDELKASLLSLIYYGFGLMGIIGFSIYYKINLPALFRIDQSVLLLTLLGIMTELSLTNFLSTVYKSILNPKIDFQKAMRDVPWIDGILKLPKPFIGVAPAAAGFVEEIFFRGVLLLIIINHFHSPDGIAILIVTLLFVIQQVIQVQNIYQAIIISCGCIAISVVGSLLVLYTNSIIPAALAHAAFVVFFFRY